MGRARSIRRMVRSEQQRALVLILFDTFQRGLDEIELRVTDILVGNHPGVFESIGVQRSDARERRLEGEEHAGLNLRDGMDEWLGICPICYGQGVVESRRQIVLEIPPAHARSALSP